MMIETWKWVHYMRTLLFGQGQTEPSVTLLSIATESQPKLQGTKNGWFQWWLSDNRLNRIEYIDTIESLSERHQMAQQMGIEHILVLESGKSHLLQQLIQAGKENIKIIFRNHSPAEVVNLLCGPDADILEAWEKLCQGKNNKPADQLVKNRPLAKAYGNSFNQWLNTLPADDLRDYLPKRFFLPSELTYVGREKKALVFALKTFPEAWLTLSKQRDSPSVDANTLDDPFWMKWLKKCRVPNKELEAVGLDQLPTEKQPEPVVGNIMNNGLGMLQRPRVWGPVLAGIVVFAVLFFWPQSLIPEMEPGYQVALQKELSPNREQAFLTNSLGFSGTGLPSVSFTEGYKGGIARLSKNDYKPYSQAEKELPLFWRLGEWVALLDAGCSHKEKLDNSAFWQPQQTIAKALIDAFNAHNPPKAKTVVGVLDKMDTAITEKLSGNKKTNTALCHDLKGFSVQMAVELQ